MTMRMKIPIKTPLLTYEQPVGLFIDGKWTEGTERKTFKTVNPCDESVICDVCEAGPEGWTPVVMYFDITC